MCLTIYFLLNLSNLDNVGLEIVICQTFFYHSEDITSPDAVNLYRFCLCSLKTSVVLKSNIGLTRGML